MCTFFHSLKTEIGTTMSVIYTQIRSVFFISVLILFSCGIKEPDRSGEKILVKIGDKTTISLNEFIRRAEYTPRPDYCRLNSYLNKKIILNSLVAEKLLAMEAGENNPITQDEAFQNYIRGRKEQAMRQWMHHVEATEQVVLDPDKVKKAFRMAGREYEIEYYTVNDTSSLVQAGNESDPGQLFEDRYFRMTGDTLLPRRKVKWADREHPLVYAALFENNVQKGEVLKPITIAQDQILCIKILGWSDEMALTEQQQRERLNQVREKLSEIESAQIWTKRVSEIMRGKRIDFDEAVFRKLSSLFFSVYFHTEAERRDQFIEKIWGLEEEDPKKIIENLNDADFLKQPFFQVDGTVWTVADFRQAIQSHPLVYRERKMRSDAFAGQFRLAVADLVRDTYVTKEAYKKGYDRVPVVQRNVNMWRDSYIALYQRKAFLDSVGEKRNFIRNYHAIIEDRLNPYVRNLQKKYDKQIELDFDCFESISLSSVDLFVKQSEQPFIYVVPTFPLITTEHLIDYMTRMRR
jgi:hypothetical protein